MAYHLERIERVFVGDLAVPFGDLGPSGRARHASERTMGYAAGRGAPRLRVVTGARS